MHEGPSNWRQIYLVYHRTERYLGRTVDKSIELCPIPFNNSLGEDKDSRSPSMDDNDDEDDNAPSFTGCILSGGPRSSRSPRDRRRAGGALLPSVFFGFGRS
jgi:hypothetical protein